MVSRRPNHVVNDVSTTRRTGRCTMYEKLKEEYLKWIGNYWQVLWEPKGGILPQYVDYVLKLFSSNKTMLEDPRDFSDLVEYCRKNPDMSYNVSWTNFYSTEQGWRVSVYVSLDHACEAINSAVNRGVPHWLHEKLALSSLHFAVSHELYHARFLLPLYQIEMEEFLKSVLPYQVKDEHIKNFSKFIVNFIHDLFANEAAFYDMFLTLKYQGIEETMIREIVQRQLERYVTVGSIEKLIEEKSLHGSGEYINLYVYTTLLIGKDSMREIINLIKNSIIISGFPRAFRIMMNGMRKTLIHGDREWIKGELLEVLISIVSSLPEQLSEYLPKDDEVENRLKKHFENMDNLKNYLVSYVGRMELWTLEDKFLQRQIDYKRRPRRYYGITEEFNLDDVLLPSFKRLWRRVNVVLYFLLAYEHWKDAQWLSETLREVVTCFLRRVVDGKINLIVNYLKGSGDDIYLETMKIHRHEIATLQDDLGDLAERLLEVISENVPKYAEIRKISKEIKRWILHDMSRLDLLVYLGSWELLEELGLSSYVGTSKLMVFSITPPLSSKRNVYFLTTDMVRGETELWKLR